MSDMIWITADGRKFRIQDMELGHLVNTLNWVMYNDYDGATRARFEGEARIRQINGFFNKEPYPVKIDGKWYVYDFETKSATIIPPPDEYIEAVKDNPDYIKRKNKVPH